MMEGLWRRFTEVVQQYLGLGPAAVERLAWTVFILLALALAGYLAARLVRRRVEDGEERRMALKTVAYVLGFVAFLALIKEWFTPLLSFADDTGLSESAFGRLVWTVAVLLAVWLSRYLTALVITQRLEDAARRYIAIKTSTYVLGFIAFFALVKIWVGGFIGLAAYFGLLSAGVAIALKDPLTNLAGWAFISLRRLFAVGDRIQIDQHAGDVIDIRLFQFSLVEIGNWVNADQSTGRIIHIPNGWVFQHALANYTQGFNFIWNEIPVMVTFESNWQHAKDLVTEIGKRHTAIKSEHAAQQIRRASSKYLIYFRELTPIVWTAVADSGVVLTLRYLCEPRNRRGSATAIWEEILKAFAEAPDIDFAYPTQRFYDNAAEAKSDLRPRETPKRD